MKKTILFLLTFTLLFALTACADNVIEFTAESGETYFCDCSDGIKSVTNYHPNKLGDLPKYQELIQYGAGAGLENDGIVYFIYIVDTSIEPDDPKAYYTAELDGATRALLSEEGEYFSEEAEKNAVVEKLLGVMDEAKFE